METEATDDYLTRNGDCSPGNDHSRTVDLSVSVPNGQHPHLRTSPSTHLVKLERETGENGQRKDSEEMGQNEEEGMSDSPSNLHNGEPGPEGPSDIAFRLPHGDRPFHCSQCGVSFTQKGNLLRHIKLHTGEKPFKCPFCSYACRRRDALTGHLRTHSVGKPYKCSFCGRSYKQRTSLEEHKERCHNYLQSVNSNTLSTESYQDAAESRKEQVAMMEAVSLVPFDRPPVIERLQANVGKRKSTVPQKFVDEKLARYSYPEMSYEQSLKYEKEAELMQAHIMDQAINNAMSYLGTNSLRPIVHHPSLSMPDMVPMVNPLYSQVYQLGPRMDRPSNQNILPPLPPPLESPPSNNSPLSLIRPKTNREESPSSSCLESTGSEHNSPQNHPVNSLNHAPYFKSSPRSFKETGQEALAGTEIPFERSTSGNLYRVFSKDGQELRAFKCDYCRVLFLDHVMYTIHMGCHGYRNPWECNICGRRSRDRYEFTSHIVRGEHTFH
ncbi:zinc finger protein Helios-like [Scleropages formosus]|uniref:IKAROS family zinc finger 2 n=1 Tax=Scleropages formosus TaxID=113540 RepID=A0A8C9SFB3_SCLFO|nr:zinc finger protein Helios [Scleropages formosus]